MLEKVLLHNQMTFWKEQAKNGLIAFFSVLWHSALSQRCENLCVNHTVPIRDQRWESLVKTGRSEEMVWNGSRASAAGGEHADRLNRFDELGSFRRNDQARNTPKRDSSAPESPKMASHSTR